MSKRSRSGNTIECSVQIPSWKAEFYELMQLWAYSEKYPALVGQALAPLNKQTFKGLVRLMHILKTEPEMEPYLNRVKRSLVSELNKEDISYKRFQKLYAEIDRGRLSADVLKAPHARKRESQDEVASALRTFWRKIENEERISEAARDRKRRINAKKLQSSVNAENAGLEDTAQKQHICEDPYKARVLEIHGRISRFGTAFRVWATFASIMSVASVVLVFATYRAPEVDPLLSYVAVAAISLCTLVCVISSTAIMLTHVLRCRNEYIKFCNEERVRMGIKENDGLPYELASLSRNYFSLLAGRIGIGATAALLAVAVWTGRMWYQSEWGLPATITHEMIAGLVGMVFAMFVLTALSLDCTKVMAADGKAVASLYNSNSQHEFCNKLNEKGKHRRTLHPIRATRIPENHVESSVLSSDEEGSYVYNVPKALAETAELVAADQAIGK